MFVAVRIERRGVVAQPSIGVDYLVVSCTVRPVRLAHPERHASDSDTRRGFARVPRGTSGRLVSIARAGRSTWQDAAQNRHPCTCIRASAAPRSATKKLAIAHHCRHHGRLSTPSLIEMSLPAL